MGKILVDVDGVINKFGPKNWEDKEFRAMNFPITYSPRAIGLLLDLSAKTGWELMWATTWNERANEYIAPAVGLPELPVVEMNLKYRKPQPKFSEYVSIGEFKADSLVAQIKEPFVWFDDEHDLAAHLKGRLDFPWKVVYVDEREGLTEANCAEALKWIRAIGVEVT